jgi:hypothetical protein
MMATRRRRGEHSISFEHLGGACRDPERHRSCPGRWVGQISLGYQPNGSRKRKRVSGTTKAIVQARLRELERDLDSGVEQRAYTVRQAIDDWLATTRPARAARAAPSGRGLPRRAIASSRRC